MHTLGKRKWRPVGGEHLTGRERAATRPVARPKTCIPNGRDRTMAKAKGDEGCDANGYILARGTERCTPP